MNAPTARSSRTGSGAPRQSGTVPGRRQVAAGLDPETSRVRRSGLPHRLPAAERAQALVEAALVLPVLLLLAFAVVGVHRVAQGKLGVSAVAREAATAGARSDNPAGARARAEARGREVGAGYGLTNGTLRLTVAVWASGRSGDVTATASYNLDFADLPLLDRWSRLTVASTHVAPLEPFRSRWPAGEAVP